MIVAGSMTFVVEQPGGAWKIASWGSLARAPAPREMIEQEVDMDRKYIDCRRVCRQSAGCSIAISADSEDESRGERPHGML